MAAWPQLCQTISLSWNFELEASDSRHVMGTQVRLTLVESHVVPIHTEEESLKKEKE